MKRHSRYKLDSISVSSEREEKKPTAPFAAQITNDVNVLWSMMNVSNFHFAEFTMSRMSVCGRHTSASTVLVRCCTLCKRKVTMYLFIWARCCAVSTFVRRIKREKSTNSINTYETTKSVIALGGSDHCVRAQRKTSCKMKMLFLHNRKQNYLHNTFNDSTFHLRRRWRQSSSIRLKSSERFSNIFQSFFVHLCQFLASKYTPES